MKNEIIKLGLILGIVSMVASASLALVNGATQPIIETRIALEADQARQELLPDADAFEKQESELPDGVLEVYTATKSGEPVGYIVTTQSKGYGGSIDITVGIDATDHITGVKLSNMSETPGLGAKATEPAFIDQYMGVEAMQTPVVNKNATGAPAEIVAISGATITSDAVTRGVTAALEYYNGNLK